ncbi:cytosolic sulfotransferase 12-like [Diospyros lotus]|uniref:cytosolic sulfotransferase 12-like n=1 Tax=Diospyros lotus TaxID=55363 RepID=UPI0022549F3E|nr:cytosolic sulfotransferase 12-like [Diospyros lotus]
MTLSKAPISSVISYFMLTSGQVIPLPPAPKYLQEDDLTLECRQLLPSLPREPGWIASSLYQYQGFWYASRQLQEVLECQQHFQARDSDVLLVTTPKSGTTWLKAIVFAIVNREAFPPAAAEHHPLLVNNPHDLVPFLERKFYVDKNVPDLASLASPRLLSTHLPNSSLPESVKSSACKLVYLCRNPMDTFVSLWHFTNELRPKNLGDHSLEDSFDRFCRGASLCGPFWDHVLGYWEESLEKPQKVLVLTYEEMKENPNLYVRKLAEFLGCPFSQEEDASGLVDEVVKLCSFGNLSNLEVNKNGKLSSGVENRVFFRRGEVGDWKNLLTAEMLDTMEKISEEKLGKSGMKFRVS